MMMKITKELFLILLSLIFLVDKSLSIVQNELNILNIIYTTLSLTPPPDYCASPNSCNSAGNIVTLNITSPIFDTSSTPVPQDQIFTLTFLETIYLYNLKIDVLLISTTSVIKNLYAIGCDFTAEFSEFSKSLNLININGIKTARYMTLISDQFGHIEDVTFIGPGLSITFQEGSLAPKTKNLKIYSSNIPTFSTFSLTTLDITFLVAVSLTTPLSSWTSIENIYIDSTASSNEFPSFGLLASANTKTITTRCKFSAPSTLIDLSNLASVISFSLYNVGDLFSISGGLPFLKFPPNANVYISGGTFNSPPRFDYFNNIGSSILSGNTFNKTGLLDLDYTPTNVGLISINKNSLGGSVPTSYCALNISNYRFNDNQLNQLPGCFSCYLSDQNVKDSFLGNAFISSSVVCKDIILPTIEVVNNQYLRLEGSNLGFSGKTILSDSLTWTMIKPSTLFESSNFVSGLKKIDVLFSIPSLKFTFALDQTVLPIITNFNKITNGGNQFSITGEFFSNSVYNSSVTIDGKICVVSSSSFNSILCSVDPNGFNLSNSHSTLKVTIDGLKTTTVYVSLLDGANNGNVCSACSTVGGICNLSSSKCECLGNFGTSDCSKCVTGWKGDTCSAVAYSFSSISSPKDTGGNVQVAGYFGLSPAASNFKIMIGSSECVIGSIVSNLINCAIGQGTGKQIVKITYPDGVYSGFEFSYTSTEIPCPSTCIHGSCDTTKGSCVCQPGYQGLDCGSKSPTSGSTTATTTGNNNGGVPGSNTSVDTNTGGTSINNQQTNYEIYLTSIIELDINSEVVQNHTLKNNWKLLNSTQEGRVTFQQSLIAADGSGGGGNITFIIDEVSLEKYPNGKEYSFAGVDFLVTGGSLKMQFSITGYVYENSLNSLQVTMESSVSELNVENENECSENQKATSIEAVESGGNLNYLKISKDSKIFYGRFIDRALSDGRPTFIKSFVKSKSDKTVIVGINLPHCVEECLIDPDFSVLVAPEFVSSCSSNKRANWVIPVAVVIPVVGLTIIVVVTILVLKKNRMSIKLKLNKLKSVSMKSFKN